MGKKVREEQEQKMAEMKQELKDRAEEVYKTVSEIEANVKKAEEAAKELMEKVKSEGSTLLLKMVDEAQGLATEAKEELETQRKESQELCEDVEDPLLKAFISVEVKKIQGAITAFENRLSRTVTTVNAGRDNAKRKEVNEVAGLEKTAIAMIKYHQAKN